MIYLRIMWQKLVTFYKNMPNWSKILVIILAILLSLAGAFLLGWFLNKPTIIEKERIVEKIKTEIQEKIVYKEKIVEKKVYVKDVHKVTSIQTKPDGSTNTTIVEDSGTHINTDTQTDKDKVKTVEVIKFVDRVVEKEKIITYGKPNWRVGLLAGVDVGALVGSRNLLITEPYNLVFGINAERRIIGPIYMGVFGLTSGEAGISISGSF